MYKIFISHSSKNKSFIKRLKQYFPARDYLVWVSFDDVKTGAKFDDEILKGIKKSDCIIYILSKKAIKSPYVNQEIGYALALGKEIVPVIENFKDLPGFLRNRHAIQVNLRSPKKTYSKILPKLPNKDIFQKKTIKEEDGEKTLILTITGNDMWIEVLKNMEIGPTPISSFAGSFKSYMDKNKTHRKMIDNRINVFHDFFIDTSFVEPIDLESVKDEIYSYDDLKDWEKHIGKQVVYRLSEEGKPLLKRLKRAKVGDTFVWKIKKYSSLNL